MSIPKNMKFKNITAGTKDIGTPEPATGTYSLKQKGRQAFGSNEQGFQMGMRLGNQSDCTNRTMSVSTTALTDQGSAVLLLELGSY